jgi:hypothetical protein
MSNSLKHKIVAGGLLAFAVTAQGGWAKETGAGVGGAAKMRPAAAYSIDLGPVAGVAYYTVERDGFHLVATLAPASETATPFRVEAVLAPGQRVTLSTRTNWFWWRSGARSAIDRARRPQADARAKLMCLAGRRWPDRDSPPPRLFRA